MEHRPFLPASVLLATLACALAAPAPAGGAEIEPLALARFSQGDAEGWKVRRFEGETRYRIVEIDGRKAMRADSAAAAASLYLEREIDIAARQVLEWSWRIERTVPAADERAKAGDDFAARVYVVAPGEGLFALPIAISYVWAGRARIGEDWPNPFTEKVRMVAVESGDARAGEWRNHRRDLRADFRRFFGRDVKRLEGVAIMTDADNTGGTARAWYGDILLRPAE